MVPAWLFLIALAAAPGSGATADPNAAFRAWIKAGQYALADSAATAQLQRVDAGDSLAYVRAWDPVVQARTAGSLGNLAELQVEAERSLRVKRARLKPDDPDIAVSLTNLGEVLRARGKSAAAYEQFTAALAIRESANGPESLETAAALNDVAKTLRDLSRSSESKPLFVRALAIREAKLAPNDPELAISLTNLGNVLRDEGDLVQAQALLERAVAIRRQAFGNDNVLLSRSLQGLAALKRRAGDYDGARADYDEALAIAKRALPPGHPELARYYTAAGTIAWTMADYEGARVYFETALDISRRAVGPEHPSITPPLANLGVTAFQLGDYEQAVTYLRAAVANARKTQGARHRNTASALNNLGIALHDLGRYVEADTVHTLALDIYESLGDSTLDLASTLINRAQDAERLGDLAQATADSRRALAIFEHVQPNSVEIASALENLALLAAAQGQHREAVATYQRAIDLRRRMLGPEHPLLASPLAWQAASFAALGDARAASAAALEAETIRRDNIRRVARALPQRQALRYQMELSSGLDVAVGVAVTSGSDSLAAAAWDAVVRSRALVLDEMASRRRSLRPFAAEPADVAALRREVAHARQQFAGLAVRGPEGDSIEEYRALLDSARAVSERAERALLARSASGRQARAREDVGLDAVVAALPPAAALVSFVRYEASYAAFVRAPDGTRAVVALGRAGEIDSLIARWRSRAGSLPASGGAETRLSQALRARIWDPVEKRIGASAVRVVIVPDGAIHLVNFAALRRADASFLVENGPTLQLFSAERDVVPQDLGAGSNTGFLALGNPDFDAPADVAAPASAIAMAAPEADLERGPPPCVLSLSAVGWERLPESQREVTEIEALWNRVAAGSGDFRGLSWRSASEDEFKRLAPGSRYLHLATHAYFLGACRRDERTSLRGVGGLASGPRRAAEASMAGFLEENPLMGSGIVLAGANRAGATSGGADDGILMAEEIGAMDLTGVESAVLSGCDTGVGVIRTGEGVLGLRRAFQIAGARGLVLTLWPVSDKAAREWMERFYEARLGRGMDATDAAREASRATLRARRAAGQSVHPSFWAAFITTE